MDNEIRLEISNLLIQTNATAEFFVQVSDKILEIEQSELEFLIVELHNSTQINLHDCVAVLDSTMAYHSSINIVNNCLKECVGDLRQIMIAVNHTFELECWYGVIDAFEFACQKQNLVESCAQVYEELNIENHILFGSVVFLQLKINFNTCFDKNVELVFSDEKHKRLGAIGGLSRIEFDDEAELNVLINAIKELGIKSEYKEDIIAIIYSVFGILEMNVGYSRIIIELILLLFRETVTSSMRFDLERLIWTNKERISSDKIIELLNITSLLECDAVPRINCMDYLLNHLWLEKRYEQVLELYENCYNSINKQSHDQYFDGWYSVLSNSDDISIIGNNTINFLLTRKTIFCALVEKIVSERRRNKQRTEIAASKGLTIIDVDMPVLTISIDIIDEDAIYFVKKILGWLCFYPEEMTQLCLGVIRKITDKNIRDEAISIFINFGLTHNPVYVREYVTGLAEGSDIESEDWLNGLLQHTDALIEGLKKGRLMNEMTISTEQINVMRKREILKSREFRKDMVEGSQFLQLVGKTIQPLYGSGIIYQQIQSDGSKKRIEQKHSKTSIEMRQHEILMYDPVGFNGYFRYLRFEGLTE